MEELAEWARAAATPREREQRQAALERAPPGASVRDGASWTISQESGDLTVSPAWQKRLAEENRALHDTERGRAVVVIHGNWDLSDLDEITDLPPDLAVAGDLVLTNCAALRALPHKLAVRYNLVLTKCVALTAIPNVRARSLLLADCNHLQSLSPDARLSEVTLSLTISSRPFLRSVLERLDLSVSIMACDDLRTLSIDRLGATALKVCGCRNLTRISGSLRAKYSVSLIDLEALERVDARIQCIAFSATNCPILAALPQNMVVGSISLEKVDRLTSFPERITFTLPIHHVSITQANALECISGSGWTTTARERTSRAITLTDCPALRDGRDVAANSVHAHELPRMQDVSGFFGAASQIHKVHITNCYQVTSLFPRGVLACKELRLFDTNIMALPTGLTVSLEFNVGLNHLLRRLPEHLTVLGDLKLSTLGISSPLTRFPAQFTVGKNIQVDFHPIFFAPLSACTLKWGSLAHPSRIGTTMPQAPHNIIFDSLAVSSEALSWLSAVAGCTTVRVVINAPVHVVDGFESWALAVRFWRALANHTDSPEPVALPAATSTVVLLEFVGELRTSVPMMLAESRELLAQRVLATIGGLGELSAEAQSAVASAMASRVRASDPLQSLTEVSFAICLARTGPTHDNMTNLSTVAAQLEVVHSHAKRMHDVLGACAELFAIAVWLEAQLAEPLRLGNVIPLTPPGVDFPWFCGSATDDHLAAVLAEATSAVQQPVVANGLLSEPWPLSWPWWDTACAQWKLEEQQPLQQPDLARDAEVARRFFALWVDEAVNEAEAVQRQIASKRALRQCVLADASNWAPSGYLCCTGYENKLRSEQIGFAEHNIAGSSPIGAPGSPKLTLVHDQERGRQVVVVDGDWDISGLQHITTLPQELCIRGSLDARFCSGLVELPSLLAVAGDVYLRGCVALRHIDSIRVAGAIGDGGIDVFGLQTTHGAPNSLCSLETVDACAKLNDVYLWTNNASSALEFGPADVAGSFGLVCAGQMCHFPARFSVGGDMWLAGLGNNARLFDESLQVGGSAALSNLPNLTEIGQSIDANRLLAKGLPCLQGLASELRAADLAVDSCNELGAWPSVFKCDSLRVWSCPQLNTLPQTVFAGSVQLASNGLQLLPAGLTIGGDLILGGDFSSVRIEALPPALRLGGDLQVYNCSELSSIPSTFLDWGPKADGSPHLVYLRNTGVPRAAGDWLRNASAAHVRFEIALGWFDADESGFETLEEAVAFWCAEAGGDELNVGGLAVPAHALRGVLGFLSKLREAKEMALDESRSALARRIVDVLGLLHSAGEDTRAAIIQRMEDSIDACHDKPVWALNQMELAVRVNRACGDRKSLRELGRGVMRLGIVHDHVQRKIASLGWVDDVCVYLKFEIELRESLDLPVSASAMHFPNFIKVSNEELAAACDAALGVGDDAFEKWLEGWTEWQRMLRHEYAEHLKWQDLPEIKNSGRSSWRKSASKRRASRVNLVGGAFDDPVEIRGQVWSLTDLLRHWTDTGKDLMNMPLSLEEMKSSLMRL